MSLRVLDYLVARLKELGVLHVFGIPGDYVLPVYDALLEKGISIVTTCDEEGAGFAADAYARIRGMGAVCVTYCVGGLKVANTTAGAYAEKSPVLVLSGAPGMKEREKNSLLHHKVRDFDTQRRVFEELTVACTLLSEPERAPQEVDRVLTQALRYKRPVYIELPRDTSFAPLPSSIPFPPPPLVVKEPSDPEALEEALEEAVTLLTSAQKPCLLADVEIHRFGLQQELEEFALQVEIPVAATLLGKSVIAETHPYYMGVYEGALGRPEVREYVESSDCLLMLGVFMTDINLGIYTAQLDPARCIYATSERLSIRYHRYENVTLEDFLRGLLKRTQGWKAPRREFPRPPGELSLGEARDRVTVRSLFGRLNRYLTDETVVIADVGDALFGAADLLVHQRTEFLGSAYYASLGFAVPGALGAQLANARLRPLVLVGDGAFQMTGMELSTIARWGLDPIVLLLDNQGYGTERQIRQGPYNELLPWNYWKVPDVLGTGRAFLVETNEQLESALQESFAVRGTFSLIQVRLNPEDRSPALARLAERLAAQQ